ncbi:MAG: hypothetical protein Q9182_004169 [Xanthomendoza sp. 2 TL-2023]
MKPEDIPLGYYTHINFAFALIDPQSFRIAPMDDQTASLYKDVTGLKNRQAGLQVWIAIGGWAMNDPGPMRTTFSDLAKSESAQDAFFESLLTFMIANDFDGVDLDWYDGTPANLMHGVWDSGIKSLGPYAYAHTNLTEINLSLELLWRNNIDPARVVMGLGFYGRSNFYFIPSSHQVPTTNNQPPGFTMKDPTCLHAGCPFSDGAKGGECTGTPGVLSAGEIQKVIQQGAKMTFDEAAAMQIVTWDTDQWVSWDDKKTLKMKVDFANKRCLGGTMIWAIDLDDGTLIDALGANMGRPKQKTFPDAPIWGGTDLGTGRKRDEL